MKDNQIINDRLGSTIIESQHQFIEDFRFEKNPQFINKMLKSLHFNNSESIQKTIISLGLFTEVKNKLSSEYYEILPKLRVKLWVNSLKLLIFFEKSLKQIKENQFIFFLINELRKENNNMIREEIIMNSIEFLFDFLGQKSEKFKQIYMILLEFVSYPYTIPKFLEIKDYILNVFSVKKIGFKGTVNVASIVLHHFPSIPDQFWKQSSRILSKCFEISLTCDNFLEILKILEKNNRKINLKILYTIKNSLDPDFSFCNYIKKFICFKKECSYAYTKKEGIIKSNSEFSIVFWVYFSKSNANFTIFELIGNKKNKLIIKLLNNKIILEGICSSSIFSCESSDALLKNSWNFIGICVNSRKSEIIMKVNYGKSLACEISGKIFASLNFFTIFLGSNSEKTNYFTGRIAALYISKITLTDTQLNFFLLNPYLSNVNNSKSKDDLEEINLIKSSLSFSLSPDNIKSELSINGNLFQRFLIFYGTSLYDALKATNGHFHMISEKIKIDEFIEILKIFTIILNNQSIYDIINEDFIDYIGVQISKKKLNLQIIDIYTKMIFSISNINLRKKALIFCLADYKICHILKKSEENLEIIDQVVYQFSKVFEINEKNILWLVKLVNHLEQKLISHVFRHFIEILSIKSKASKILTTLIKSDEVNILEGLLDLINSLTFEGECENFIAIMLLLLKYPMKESTHTSVLKIIYNDLNEILYKYPRIQDEIRHVVFRYINERFSGIDPLIECVLHYGIKSANYNTFLKHEFFDTVLQKIKYLSNPTYIDKFFTFLNENTEELLDYIYDRDIYPNWLIDLYRHSENLGKTVASFIISKTSNYVSFKKLIIFFDKIQKFSSSFDLFFEIFQIFIEKSTINTIELISEFALIFELFQFETLDHSKFALIVYKTIDLGLNFSMFNILPNLFNNEPVQIPQKHYCRIIVNYLIKCIINHCPNSEEKLKNLMEKTNFFKSFVSTSETEKKQAENKFLIYIFCALCEIIYNKDASIIEFFKDFVANAEIESRLQEFVKSLNVDKYNYCAELIQSSNIQSRARFYIENVNKNFWVLAPDLTIKQVNLIKNSSVLETMFTADWILNVHYLLLILIFLPLKRIKFPINSFSRPESPLKSQSSLNINFEILLENTPIDEFNEEKSFLLKYMNYKVEVQLKNKHKKSIQNQTILEGKFYLKNKNDKFFKHSRLKFSDKNIVFDSNSTVLFKESILRSEALTDTESKLMRDSSIRFMLRKKNSVLQSKSFIQFECEQIKISGSYFGELRIYAEFLEFECKNKQKDPEKYFGSALNFTIKSKICHYIWKFSEISEVLAKRFIHRNSAIEIYFKNGKSYFFNIFTKKARTTILERLQISQSMYIYPSVSESLISNFTLKWSQGKITNLQYLLALNKYAGRSFHDLSQYFIFPWILKQYDSESFDVNNPSMYRDLNFPVGAQTQQSKIQLRQKYLENCDDFGKYHHGQHYSNSAICLYYLIRLEPFTTQAKLLQGGDFDHPDRIFYSMQFSWESGQKGTGDTKELIPELFYLPFLFENLNGCVMGKNCKLGIDSSEFQLPKWATNSYDFIRKHRKALESNFVSANINAWIDLIFGVKQSGKLAEDFFNVFHPITYYEKVKKNSANFNLREMDCVVDQIYHFGQTPKQIFFETHPKRKYLPYETIFDKWYQQKDISHKFLNFVKSGQILNILVEVDSILLFLMIISEIKILKFEVTEKTVNKPKEIVLKCVRKEDFEVTPLFLMWKKYIVSGGYKDCSIKLHNVSGEMALNLYYHPYPVTSITCKDYLITASYIIVSWNNQCKISKVYNGHKEKIICLSYSENNKLIASVSQSGKLILHESDTCEIIFSMELNVNGVIITELGLICCWNNEVIFVYTVEGSFLWNIETRGNEGVKCNNFGDFLVFYWNNSITICDIYEKNLYTKEIEGIKEFAVSKTEKNIMCACEIFNEIYVCNLTGLKN